MTNLTAADLAARFTALTGKTIKAGSYSKAAWLDKIAAVEAAAAPAEPEVDESLIREYGVEYCPHCNVHLSNGVGVDGDEVNNTIIRHKHHVFCCLGCNAEFGPELKGDAPTDISFEGPTFTLVQVAAALNMTGKAARAKYRRYENDGVSTRYVFDNNSGEIARVVSVLKGKRG